MCGIYAVISVDGAQPPSHDLTQSLSNRGPDYLGEVTRTVSNSHPDAESRVVSINFTSTVLALRGDHVAKQPFEDAASGAVLCWNGEAWKLDDTAVQGNDGEVIFAKLSSVTAFDVEERKHRVLEVLRSIQGPFAFMYYDAVGQRLYFGRDRLGRRSLLVRRGEGGRITAFSSIADARSPEWTEVDAVGIHSIQLGFYIPGDLGLTKDEWLPFGGADLVSSIGRFNSTLPQGQEVLDFSTPSVDIIRNSLTESLRLRLENIPEPPPVAGPQSEVDVRVAILFSGGLDCTILARLASEILPSSQGIDLINVAFENARTAAASKGDASAITTEVFEACPDRKTGRKAFAELKASCPLRWWRFIAVNVPFVEAMAHRSKVVSLMYPHQTEMDLSISLALYFASRGMGEVYVHTADPDASAPSATSPARVLLSGLGADELFGGYSRHEQAFKRAGYTGLIDELRLDVSRIGERNLGRDDRILSHWGKEVRFPYLDENFIRFAIGCPVWEKCDFENQFHPAVIEPAKRVLRLVADQLGLPSTAREKKRAIQFGARTAKLERTIRGPRVQGTDLIS